MKGYGILNVNPNADLLPKAQDSFTRALGISNDIYGMVGKHYENKFKDAQARNANAEASLREGTLDSDINAKNTKNQTDIQYYPQLQAAELAKQGASIKEIQARTGLSYAEAGAARARATASYADANRTNANLSPIAKQQALYNQYANADPGSREQMYYAGLLKEEMGKFGQYSGGMPQSGGGASIGQSSIPPTPQGGAVPTGNSDWQKDPKFGSNRMGAGGTYTNTQNGQQISTPTNSTTSKNQASIQALQRVTPLIQDLSKNISQFQTAKAKGSLGLQTLGNLFGGNYPLPNQKAQGEQDLALAPESLLKAYQLNTTDQSLNTMKDAIRPRTGETTSGYQSRLVRTLNTLRENEEAAKTIQAKGIDVTQPGAQGSPNQQYQDPFYDAPNIQQKDAVASGFNGNPNVQQQQQSQPQQQQQQIESTKSIGKDQYVKINGKWYHK